MEPRPKWFTLARGTTKLGNEYTPCLPLLAHSLAKIFNGLFYKQTVASTIRNANTSLARLGTKHC